MLCTKTHTHTHTHGKKANDCSEPLQSQYPATAVNFEVHHNHMYMYLGVKAEVLFLIL